MPIMNEHSSITHDTQMALTPELVRQTMRPEPDLGDEPGLTPLSDQDLDELARRLDRECGDGHLWIFAYGSLIWKPDHEAVEQRRATAFGWHRAFTLRMNRWRGSPRQHGLMMALKRGGRCDGVIFRLPDQDRIAQLRRVVLREIRYRENAQMLRWMDLHTSAGKTRALVFWAGTPPEKTGSEETLDEVAHVLARACGPAGSCAEYLYNTVLHLRQAGINDRNLWRLQELVADQITALRDAQITR